VQLDRGSGYEHRASSARRAPFISVRDAAAPGLLKSR
jgi:hypothetical protein